MGITCTVTMPNETSAEHRSVIWDDLYKADYQFATPFLIVLEEGEFIAEQIVRLIPGRRMVAFGTWRGLPAVIKLFYDYRHAKRHFNEDASGVKTMIENKIPTPSIYFEGRAQDDRIFALVLQRIQQGEDLEKIWQLRESNDSVLEILQGVMVELATQHVLGVMQKDMHMGNFLIDGKTIYTLDGADISSHGELLPKELSMKNLALFLSQLGTGVETLQKHLFRYYAKLRGWLLKPQDWVDMQLQIKKWNESRWQKFEKKIFRNSTDFIAVKKMALRGMMRRDCAGKELYEFMQQPDAVFSRPDVVMLKNGNSSTVISVNLDGRELVIKRYNMKNIRHRLRRALRVTRAQKSWRLAQKLNLFYVNTATPVAYLEANVVGIRGKSYFVTERVRGENIKDYLQQYASEPSAALSVVKRVSGMLRSLAKLEMTHGDLKASNIIINEHLQPVLIDLDGGAEHFSATGLNKAWNLELQRFMRNFADLPAVQQLFKQSLLDE